MGDMGYGWKGRGLYINGMNWDAEMVFRILE